MADEELQRALRAAERAGFRLVPRPSDKLIGDLRWVINNNKPGAVFQPHNAVPILRRISHWLALFGAAPACNEPRGARAVSSFEIMISGASAARRAHRGLQKCDLPFGHDGAHSRTTKSGKTVTWE